MKKFMSVVLTAAMATGLLAGCGSSSTGSSSSTTTSEASTSTAEAAGSTAAAADANGEVKATGDGPTFKIGAIGPLTGAAAQYGQGVVWGAEEAVKEINAAGGINGYQIEYKGEDDELDNEKSVNAYNTLKDWGMQMLVGSTTSACSIAVSERTKADSMFQLTPSGSAADCVKYDNVFRVCFADPAQGTKSAEYIAKNKLAENVGIIYDSSDVYSSGIEAAFVKEAEKQGLKVSVEEAFTADSNTDFTAQLQKCKDAGVDLVFLPIYYTQAATILTQADTLGLDAKYFGCDGLDGMLDMKNFNKELAEGVMLLTPFSATATDDATQKFVAAFKADHDQTPNQFAADAYDAIYAIKAAAEKENVTPDMSVADIEAALAKGMTEVTVEGLTGTITWQASGEPDKEPKAVVIKDGAYEMMESTSEATSSTAA
ncbi:MAG: ABC transporter substrate-binding protein [Lachnospiraceae bacterium]|nr:ABC transporter substrate-binding protein [Lachnospiraceae bacterium]